MKKILSINILLLTLLPLLASAQRIEGYVYDRQTSERLIGATVTYTDKGETTGTTTDMKGYYSLQLPAGGASIIVSFLGYEEIHIPIVLSGRETVTRDVYMERSVQLLENVVVSAGRFEQKINEITVSMDVVNKGSIQRQNPTDIGKVLNTLPGVDIVDNQPSVRGGNGWTYGVGSRSLVLVNGYSVLGSQGGEINWNMIPMENIEQIEVIKGASSVLYGSSALNGLINIRSGRPGLTPSTNVKYYVGIYDNPANKENIWWDKDLWKDGKYEVKSPLRNSVYSGVRNPIFEGLDLSHARRIGDFDVTFGANFLTDEGYRDQGYRKRFRFGGNVTYHQPSPNIINYGLNYDFLSEKSGDFLLWRSVNEPLRPSPVTTMGREGNTFNLDPFFNFSNLDNNTSHSIKGRFAFEDSSMLTGSNSTSLLDILGNMGTDPSTIIDIVGGDYSSIAPIIPPILSGDINGVVDNLFGFLGQTFPNATTTDYMDLISWLMNNGLPLGGTSDLVSWAANAVNPKSSVTDVNKNLTYYLDYQFHKDFGGVKLTAGTTYQHVTNKSAITGTHNTDNISLFVQYDQRFFDRLSVSAGVRGEYYRVDEHKKEAETSIFGVKAPFKPIFRGGLNYQAGEYTFIRASAGQGYRYPSITEKFARKDIGGVGVFPNYDLKAETGYNAELGIIQGYKIGGFQGFVDVAGFYTEYKNMIEFDIGFFNTNSFSKINSVLELLAMVISGDTPGLGAQFYNVGKARIYGLDASTTGTYNIAPGMKFNYNLGYIFLVPEDPEYKDKNAIEDRYTDPLRFKEKSNSSKYLKYRQKHTFKATVDFEWHRLSIGTNITCKSRMLATDFVFMDERPRQNNKYIVMDYVRDLLFGNIDGENLTSYWKKHNTGYVLMDLRVGVKVTDKLNLQMMVNNLTNKEYSFRPMALGPQRTYIMTVGYNF